MGDIIKYEILKNDKKKQLFFYSITGNLNIYSMDGSKNEEDVDDIYTIYENQDENLKKLGRYRIDISMVYIARVFFIDYDFENEKFTINSVYTANAQDEEYNFYESDLKTVLEDDTVLSFRPAKEFFRSNKIKLLVNK